MGLMAGWTMTRSVPGCWSSAVGIFAAMATTKPAGAGSGSLLFDGLSYGGLGQCFRRRRGGCRLVY